MTDTDTITSLEELEALYGAPAQMSLSKVMHRITPQYRRWINQSRFCILSTVGPEGTDASPRGDDGPVVRIVDDVTIWLPDWRGNNRTDSLRNIVRDGRVSLMFMVNGSNNVVRVNGRAILSVADETVQSFEQRCLHPRSVVVIRVDELYFQCAKALLRSGLWSLGDDSKGLPTAGAFVREFDEEFDSEGYDRDYVENAKPRMW